jgi:hypothetical protein
MAAYASLTIDDRARLRLRIDDPLQRAAPGIPARNGADT